MLSARSAGARASWHASLKHASVILVPRARVLICSRHRRPYPSPLSCSPSPPHLPPPGARAELAPVAAPTNSGRRSSISRAHGPLTSPSTSSSLLELAPAFSRRNRARAARPPLTPPRGAPSAAIDSPIPVSFSSIPHTGSSLSPSSSDFGAHPALGLAVQGRLPVGPTCQTLA